MAASEIRRAIVGNIPECLRNCVNKDYFMRSSSGGTVIKYEIKQELEGKKFLIQNLNDGTKNHDHNIASPVTTIADVDVNDESKSFLL